MFPVIQAPKAIPDLTSAGSGLGSWEPVCRGQAEVRAQAAFAPHPHPLKTKIKGLQCNRNATAGDMVIPVPFLYQYLSLRVRWGPLGGTPGLRKTTQAEQ